MFLRDLQTITAETLANVLGHSGISTREAVSRRETHTIRSRFYQAFVGTVLSARAKNHLPNDDDSSIMNGTFMDTLGLKKNQTLPLRKSTAKLMITIILGSCRYLKVVHSSAYVVYDDGI